MKTWQNVTFSSLGAPNSQWFACVLADLLNQLKASPGEVLITPPVSDMPWFHQVLIYTDVKIEGKSTNYLL